MDTKNFTFNFAEDSAKKTPNLFSNLFQKSPKAHSSVSESPFSSLAKTPLLSTSILGSNMLELKKHSKKKTTCSKHFVISNEKSESIISFNKERELKPFNKPALKEESLKILDFTELCKRSHSFYSPNLLNQLGFEVEGMQNKTFCFLKAECARNLLHELPLYTKFKGKIGSSDPFIFQKQEESVQVSKKRGRPFSKDTPTFAFLREIFKFDEARNRFECDFCERRFKNPQAKGGHISKAHRNQSTKYMLKMEVRQNRQEIREMREKTIEEFLEKKGINYSNLINEPDGKRLIRNIIKAEKTEFVKFFNQKKDE